MIKVCLVILLTLFYSSNLCLTYLLSSIPNKMTAIVSIYLSKLQYKNFLVMSFINKLMGKLINIAFGNI